MLILNATTHVLRVITGMAADVDVVASFVDRNGATFTPGNNGGVAITTATTTTIVAAPAVSTERNVKGVTIRNKDTADATLVTVQFYDGTNAFVLIAENLEPGEEIVFDSAGNWTVTGRAPRMTRKVIPGVAGYISDAGLNGYYAVIGSYRTPPSVKSLLVECVGGGGRGGTATNGATNAAAGGGGGSGQHVKLAINSPAASYQYSLGGYDEITDCYNPTSFGITSYPAYPVALIQAASGQEGQSDTVTTIHVGGLGGNASPSTSAAGYCGRPGDGFCLAAAQATSGHGGSGPYGVGGNARYKQTLGGMPGAGFGAGGSGGCIISGASNQPMIGGDGSPGVIIVTEFYA